MTLWLCPEAGAFVLCHLPEARACKRSGWVYNASLMKEGEWKGHLSTLAAAALFALMSPVSKAVMEGGAVDGLALATLRISGSALLFWALSCFVQRERIRREDWPALLGMSLCGMALNQYLYVVGIQHTSPTNACVITTSTPVMTLLLAALFLREPLTRARVLGVLLASLGALVLIVGSASTGGKGGHPLGDGLCLLSQLFAACYFVFFRSVIRRYSMVTLMKWLFTLSAVATLPFFAGKLASVPWASLSTGEGLGIAYVVGVGTFLCYLLLILGQRSLSPAVVSTYNNVQPAVAAMAGVLMGLDILTWEKLLAMLLIAVGVWKVTHSPRKEPA